MRLILSAHPVTVSTTWVNYGTSAFLLNYRPKQAKIYLGYDASFYVRVTDSGYLQFRSVNGTLTNKNLYGQYEWSMRE